MVENDYPRLCGGTFFTLLLQIKRKSPSHRDRRKGIKSTVKESAMLDGLVEVMYPNHPAPSERSIVTETTGYKNCEFSDSVNLPFLSDSALNHFDAEMKAFSLKPFIRMREFIERFFIDEESGNEINRNHLMRQIMGLIEADDSITPAYDFYLVTENKIVHKDELCRMSKLSWTAFLLSVWHFIVMQRKDNTVGQETIKRWFPEGYTGTLQIADKGLGISIKQDFWFSDDSLIQLPEEPSDGTAAKADEGLLVRNNNSDDAADKSSETSDRRTGTDTDENVPALETAGKGGNTQNYYGPAMTFNFNAPVNGFTAHADEVNNYFGEGKSGRKECADD